MRPPSSFKQDFFKKWVVGLQYYYGTSSRDMNILERKKAIKLSADVAMASARDGKTYWSRSLIAKASKQDDCISKNLVKNILGNEYERLTKLPSSILCSKRIRSKKIVRRSCNMRRIRKHAQKRVLASSIAKRMVKKRTQVLKTLVPGGESMDDEFCLLEETIDYLLSLQAQVDVMHKLVNASGLPS
ncbi:hypothetical protein AQUCO_01600397v1 [Aquilegia coerulea]|uniref:IBH1-like N-terminal domain-containing protein n=1 Tax=Aquilegia coerulea TaxID=218851 RepID=A0A2G5DRG4_AQUCA|nr:hypothetical protein AQUCO_01600397v1 [Aquilegia coerulea]